MYNCASVVWATSYPIQSVTLYDIMNILYILLHSVTYFIRLHIAYIISHSVSFCCFILHTSHFVGFLYAMLFLFSGTFCSIYITFFHILLVLLHSFTHSGKFSYIVLHSVNAALLLIFFGFPHSLYFSYTRCLVCCSLS
jgi:hypothetical protein